MDEGAEEILGVDVVPVVVVVEADDLRMGMPLGAARAGPEVAEINDGLKFFPQGGFFPFFQPEGDHFVELFWRVGGDVPIVVGGLHEDRGPGVVKDGVFIHEPDHVAAPLENLRERLRAAEGARRALRRVGFFFSDMKVKFDGICHGVTFFLRSVLRHLYYTMQGRREIKSEKQKKAMVDRTFSEYKKKTNFYVIRSFYKLAFLSWILS